MKFGDPIHTNKPIRSSHAGKILPRDGTFVRAIENMGRLLILVDFGAAGTEYIFPDDIAEEKTETH